MSGLLRSLSFFFLMVVLLNAFPKYNTLSEVELNSEAVPELFRSPLLEGDQEVDKRALMRLGKRAMMRLGKRALMRLG